VAIARALIHEPTLILADEPTGNLDDETGQRVLKLLLSLTREAGKTLIMATHSAEVVPYADVVYHIAEGKLVREGV
jgi:putative ABC transport system ATP-binding protein